ncbi:MAG: hypothetical protein CL930_00035 [Deltaproteobacteria bacterium]|nr:hypothetical protein [Deltaproteobacteria bacterium]
MKSLSRRTLLRGFMQGAAVSVALPPLEAMFNLSGTAYACGGGLPLRFGLFFWGNGNLPELWTPTGEGSSWELSEQLEPLAPVKDLISVVSGMSIKTGNLIPHHSGKAGILSGAPLKVYENGREDGTFEIPSIDQVIAAEIGGDTIYRSLETGVLPGTDGCSYNGPNNRNPPELSPYAFYERLFGASFREPGEDGVVDPRLALRRSVLDSVMDDITRLDARVGAADKIRLDQHFTGIRELELRLARLQEDPPSLEACTRPIEPELDFPEIEGRPQIQAVHRAMTDLIVMALACDQTRVFSHWFSDPLTNKLYPEATAGHHSLTHDEPGSQPEVNMITKFVMGELNYMIERLASIEEGDETLLDHMALLATSEVSKGQTHLLDEMPIIIAGNACGALNQGIHYRSFSGENTSHVLLSLVRAMNISAASFGMEEGEVTDGLAAIET